MEAIRESTEQNAALKADTKKLTAEGYKESIFSADQQYQESQARFRTVFEASRLGNNIISSDLKILELNPAMVALLGYECKDEIVGTLILDYVPAESQKEWQFLQDKLWQRSAPSFSLETSLQRKDGSRIWCQVTSILFPDNGEMLGYTIIEDVTEKHNLRLQKEEFISVASHELKTPITSLQATLQIINRLVNDGSENTDNLKKFVASAERNTAQLNNLVDDLLNSTRIEKGQLTLNTNLFTLADLIDGCCTHIRLEGKYKISYEGDHDLKILADQHKIEQVLTNFITNAVKYGPDSDEIIVRAEKISDFTKLSVIDRGIGIPAASVGKIFDRYYRVDEYKNKAPGLGLGLYICASIIRQHGGEIGVESELGKGSTFWFTIPDNSSVVHHLK